MTIAPSTRTLPVVLLAVDYVEATDNSAHGYTPYSGGIWEIKSGGPQAKERGPDPTRSRERQETPCRNDLLHDRSQTAVRATGTCSRPAGVTEARIDGLEYPVLVLALDIGSLTLERPSTLSMEGMGARMPISLPPPQPNYAEARQAEQAQKAYRAQQEARRREEEEKRKRELIAESRRRASETAQRKKP